MEDNTLVKSSFSATIHAPIENVDIPTWCFGLSESEYQSCSPAQFLLSNHDAGWSAYVHQRRSSRRKPNGAALRRGNFRTASPAARFKLRRLYANRQDKSGRDLGLEREEDRRQIHASLPMKFTAPSRRSSWTLWPNRAFHGSSSSPPASPFPRRTTGKRLLCLPKVLSVMHCETAIPPRSPVRPNSI